MTDMEKRTAAARFAADWKGRGDEKQETSLFWIALLQKVYGIEEPDKYISFEVPVKLDHTSFIDGYIESTRVLIEQKGRDIDLRRGYKQSDGSMLTPYQQARRYAGYLPYNQVPRWIIVCNFQEFQIHDMNRPNDEPEVLKLADLEKEFHRLQFLVDTGNEHIKKEMEISLQAGELVGVLYDALLKQYKDPSDPETLKHLNKLCVRLVFCLYAEDAGIFGGKSMFHDYLQQYRAKDARRALMDLFKVLDTKPEDRDPYMDEDLAAFPYVNGGLFADEAIVIPRLDETIVDLILRKASEDFDWSAISPTIFGAVFESTLNPETRRSGGMHYTSIENIHKLIDPLFLDGLKAEFAEIEAVTVERTRKGKLEAFQRKLAGLKFLDPACGSGNFLTETYISLRRLENETISLLHKGQIMLDIGNPIQVSISQFYGIEINDFAVTVAKTALWIAESQMMKETEAIAVMDKHSQKVFSTGIRVVGAENDFYTLEKMEDPYCWERIYAAGMDSQIGELIPRVISQANLLVRNRTIIINESEKVTLAAIMVMQMLRGKQTREYERKLYQNYLPDTLKKTREKFGPLNDKQNELLQAYENDDYYFKRTSMDLALDSQRITRYTEILCNLDFVFYRVLGNMEFVTSDNPVMTINLKTKNARPFANGLLKTNTAVYYPLSPKLLLCAMHPELTFGVFSSRDCSLLDLDANREAKFISTINQKQIEQCFQHAFAQSDGVLKQYRK